MRILIVSDAWHPQVNGVVRTLETTAEQLHHMGHEVRIVGPDITRWQTLSVPSYPTIRLELFSASRLKSILRIFNPDFIHIATEGPLGWTARNLCLHLKRPFTTSYHTRFPEYLAARMPRFLRRSAQSAAYALLRRFHTPSSAVMVATASLENELRVRKFHHLVRWSRGVDTALFKPGNKNLPDYAKLARPILLYVGRVAVEKNLPAFLSLHTTGTKVVIGDGPDFEALKQSHPHTVFLGPLYTEELARHYAAADLFVFPSTTDTFGLVLLEAAASGLRIASYPATGPIDIFAGPEAKAFSVLDADLNRAISQALALPDDPTLPRRYAEKFSWASCSEHFFHHLQAQTPQAIRGITRLGQRLAHSWQRALALAFK